MFLDARASGGHPMTSGPDAATILGAAGIALAVLAAVRSTWSP